MAARGFLLQQQNQAQHGESCSPDCPHGAAPASLSVILVHLFQQFVQLIQFLVRHADNLP